MKEQILKLRKEGKTYTEIQDILECSRGTISYHCGKGQKEKTKKRTNKYRRSSKSIIYRKIDLFLNRNKENKLKYSKRGSLHVLMYQKIIENPFCYLTGRELNLEDSKSYSLDHILPFSRGGLNTVDNMGLTCTDANISKTYLTLEEYVNLCDEVVRHLRNTESVV